MSTHKLRTRYPGRQPACLPACLFVCLFVYVSLNFRRAKDNKSFPPWIIQDLSKDWGSYCRTTNHPSTYLLWYVCCVSSNWLSHNRSQNETWTNPCDIHFLFLSFLPV